MNGMAHRFSTATTATEEFGSQVPGHLVDVLGVEQPTAELPIEVDERRAELVLQTTQLDRTDLAVGVLVDEQQVDHTHQAA